ncbi:MAG: hypothetical protein ACOYNI_06425 [Acidimicrobiia bacterium]
MARNREKLFLKLSKLASVPEGILQPPGRKTTELDDPKFRPVPPTSGVSIR